MVEGITLIIVTLTAIPVVAKFGVGVYAVRHDQKMIDPEVKWKSTIYVLFRDRM